MIEPPGAKIPTMIYGTAWKEDRTAALTRMAFDAGFRAVDTANQRRHYHEAGVGEAVRQALGDGRFTRDELFLQTKFTYVGGQDHRLPYDPAADHPTQVRQSFASSLDHLGVDYLDSYLLHGPMFRDGLSGEDWLVWRTMEELQRSGAARRIGVSNVDARQLAALLREAAIKPAFVQNRCFARTGWDARVRALCRDHAVLYQGFSLLTANIAELSAPAILQIAANKKCTPAQLVFEFSRRVGMIPLTGTTNIAHMREDLDSCSIVLGDEEVAAIERVALPETAE